jgi:hypothetical protein
MNWVFFYFASVTDSRSVSQMNRERHTDGFGIFQPESQQLYGSASHRNDVNVHRRQCWRCVEGELGIVIPDHRQILRHFASEVLSGSHRGYGNLIIDAKQSCDFRMFFKKPRGLRAAMLFVDVELGDIGVRNVVVL